MTTMVTVAVPDGVFEGQEFVMEYEGQQLSVTCPEGCGPGSEINLEVPVATGAEAAGAAAPQLVEITVPDGCFPGDEFTVEFDGQSFNICVPDGVNPGEALTVEVPAAEAGPSPTPPRSSASPPSKASPAAPPPQQKVSKDMKSAVKNMAEIPEFKGPRSEKSGEPKREKVSRDILRGMDIPPFRGAKKGVTANSVNADAKWVSAGDLFSAIPTEGLGREAGDFQIGQLVQVTRSNGTWTYGKIMDYDPTGDVYTVLTKQGPKYFVERDDIVEDVVVNPSDGTCAQQ